ncbi:MAG: nucleotidyltransferase domain-containing protein [Myxococcota bacterium]|nr:nucleotidyltransferase domain-containing protein [Myxococcota bacterium]
MDEPLIAVVDRVRSLPGLRFAVLFGSVATGRAGRGSDLDVALSFDPSAQPTFEEQLAVAAELSLGAGRDVDLVVLEEAGTVLRREVARNGRLLWERDRGAFLRFRCAVAGEWEDFAPVLEVCRRGFLEAVGRRGGVDGAG